MPHLAQINIARFRTEPADPANKDFFDAVAHINALAESSPGFVWRFKDDEPEETDPFDDPRLAINMSVWETPKAFIDYVYRSEHAQIMARRKEWYDPIDLPHLAIWWIEPGHTPSLQEGKSMLETLLQEGPSEKVFGMKELVKKQF